jgi:ABC-type proline/glycine betaine transport system substrate-binding protein
VTNVLRKLALLVAVAALGLSLAGAANAKNHPPNGTINSHGLNFSDGT